MSTEGCEEANVDVEDEGTTYGMCVGRVLMLTA